MQGTILVVGNKNRLIASAIEYLINAGYSVENEFSIAEGEQKAIREPYDLIILAPENPEKESQNFCNAVHEAGKTTPILLIIAGSKFPVSTDNAEFGANDYILEPFRMQELVVRIKKFLHETDTNLVIDLKRGFILYNGTESPLSAQEIKLLDYFYRHADAIISREELLDSVWGYDQEITTRTIDVHVARLRQKMGDMRDNPKYIHTIRGVGYKFTPPEN